MAAQPFADERAFQKMLADHPELLCGDEADAEAYLLVGRELHIPHGDEGSGRGLLDHLFLDRAGVPTLVELKRSTDPGIRRKVVGQMLDYAANAVLYWPEDYVRDRVRDALPNDWCRAIRVGLHVPRRR